MIRTLLVACFASAAGSGWVRRAHKRKQRNATQPQLQPVTSEDVARYALDAPLAPGFRALNLCCSEQLPLAQVLQG